MGEQLVQESHWDPTVLHHVEMRVSDDQLRRFSSMGAITPEEVIAFHYSLEGLTVEAEESGGAR